MSSSQPVLLGRYALSNLSIVGCRHAATIARAPPWTYLATNVRWVWHLVLPTVSLLLQQVVISHVAKKICAERSISVDCLECLGVWWARTHTYSSTEVPRHVRNRSAPRWPVVLRHLYPASRPDYSDTTASESTKPTWLQPVWGNCQALGSSSTNTGHTCCPPSSRLTSASQNNVAGRATTKLGWPLCPGTRVSGEPLQPTRVTPWRCAHHRCDTHSLRRSVVARRPKRNFWLDGCTLTTMPYNLLHVGDVLLWRMALINIGRSSLIKDVKQIKI